MNKRVIYVIDDDDIFTFTFKYTMKVIDIPKEIYTFSDGEKAINYLNTSCENPFMSPDIIFLDINMPVMDGWDFLEEFDKMHKRLKKETVIYMISSSIDNADIDKARSINHIKEYIVKPLSIEKARMILSEN